jgi:hypothetical protein
LYRVGWSRVPKSANEYAIHSNQSKFYFLTIEKQEERQTHTQIPDIRRQKRHEIIVFERKKYVKTGYSEYSHIWMDGWMLYFERGQEKEEE